ncbi:MAG: sensor histidine kinase [Peptostreptococcaceae bacterium]
MIELYKKYIKNKIFNKMLLIYSLITIISISLLTTVFIIYYSENELQNELNIHSEVIFNIEKRFEEQDTIGNSVINGINTQPKIIDEIVKLTTATYEEYLSYKLDNYSVAKNKQLDLRYLLDTILSNRSDALAVVISDKNKEYKNEIVLNYDKWYDTKNNKNKYIRKITRTIKNVDTMYNIGYIDIYFDLTDLNKIVDNSNLKGSLIIIDEDDNLVFCYDEVSKEIDLKNIILQHNDSSKNNIENTSMFSRNDPIVNLREDAQTGFRYGSIIFKKDLDSTHMRFKIITVSLMCVFTILLTTSMIINRYSVKLKKMMRGIEKIKNGCLNTRFNIENEDDELDMIAIRIDEMSENLQDNINKNYIAQVKQKQAEMNALQAQINPHFLFNTLEVIRMCALASKNTEVAQMIYNLASMFRYSTYNNGSLVKLSDEVKHCKMYLDLCSTRYRGMFKYEINIDEKYFDYLIPKFTMQPILENSINHGIRKDSFDNLIDITVFNSENELTIIIEDNGKGITEEDLNSIKVNLKKDLQKASSIGLMNINNRLKLNFGDEYGININSIVNKGTCVEIKIPILRDEDRNV